MAYFVSIRFGFTIYMRDDWLVLIPSYGLFRSLGDYYSMLGAGATGFRTYLVVPYV